jgi:signal transduction histidine kinase
MYETQFNSQLFAELYDVHPQTIIWLKPVMDEDSIIDFQFVYANPEGLKYLNLSREKFEALKLSNTPTLSDKLREAVFDEMVMVFTTGKRSETVIFNPALNKYSKVLRTRLRDGVLAVVQDISEEKRAIEQLEKQTAQLEEQTRQLQEQKTLLDNIMEYSSNGISVSRIFRNENNVVVDAQTILANNAAIKYMGFPKEIYLTKRATEIEPAVIGTPYYEACVKTLETGEPFVMQYLVQSTGRWLELTVSRMDRDHLIQIFTDVTSIKEAQLQTERYIDDLKRSNQSLEDFAYAASHDLKEPIRKIHFFSDRLKEELKDQLTENQNKLFERLEFASQRMGLLVDDLLAYSQVSREAAEKEEIDLNEKLKNVLGDLELEVQQKNAQITAEKLPIITGNRRQLQQLFQNLISNALKYSKPNEQPLVHISAEKIKGIDVKPRLPAEENKKLYHLIEVRDNGIGFDQKDAERIFNVFTRLHGNAEYRGTGVGLSIAQRVVQNHNGYIWAESSPGIGTSFKVLLPVE